MKKITSLFTFTKANSTGNGSRLVVCINKDTFINASWLAKQVKLNESNLDLLVGCSISVGYYAEGEIIAEAVGDVEAKVCTKANTIVKEFSVEPSVAFTMARIYMAA